MTTPVLTTKLYIPPPFPELVPRQHLVETLNAGLNSRLTLISAPAGFGKTTLISQWISQSEIPFCWISLDENDNNPGRFLAYLVASLNTIGLGIDPDQIELLQSLEKEQIDTILTSIINQIAVAQARFAIAFDDYHHIHNQGVHQVISYLLEYLPPQVHMVISTRADPPLPIARLRAREQLVELRSADLRFNVSEGSQFINEIHELNLKLEDVQKLVSRTDGWIAGLTLASIAIKGQPDTSEYIHRFSGSHDYIVDFLTSEVLEGQPEHIQEFLLKTAILNRLTAPLCETLTGQEDCQQILKDLRSNNVFLQGLDDEHRWYAYHRLFRDLLTQQLMEKHPEEIPILCLKASQWFEEHGSLNDAIEYALQGQHMERAADLIESQAQNTILQSEIATLIGWVEKLPEAALHARPHLCIYYAWALLVSNQKLESAAQCLDQVNPTDEELQGKLNAVRSIEVAYRRQIPESIHLARQALRQLPEDEYFFRQITGWNISAALFLSGDTEGATEGLEDVARVSLASGNRMVAVVTLCRLGNIRMQQGDLHSAYTYYQQALDIASQDREKPLPVACEALIGLGRIYWEWYQFETARQLLSDGLDLSKRWRDAPTIDGRFTLANLLLSQGDTDGARRTMARIKEIAAQNILTSSGKQYVAIQEAHLQLRQGKIHPAQAWAENRGLGQYLQVEKLEISETSSKDIIRNFELGVYARILMAEKRYEEALAILSNLLPALSQHGSLAQRIEAHVLMGIVQEWLKNGKQAIESMKTALDLAAHNNFLRIFVEEGPVVIRLIRRIQSQIPSSKFIADILSAKEGPAVESREAERGSDFVEPLSEREKEVLRLLLSDLPVPEIAANIHISVSTLRTHIRNIYRKLDTHSRFETVSKAKELKII